MSKVGFKICTLDSCFHINYLSNIWPVLFSFFFAETSEVKKYSLTILNQTCKKMFLYFFSIQTIYLATSLNMLGGEELQKKNSGLVNIVIHHSGPFFNFNLGGVRHVFSLVFLLSELYVYTTAFSYVPSITL